MKTKLLAITVILSVIVPVSTADGGNLIAVASREYVNLNENFYVNISITPVQSLGGAECNISFNPSILEVEGVENGGMFEEWWDANLEIDNVNGTIKNIVAFNFWGNGTSTPGIFATVTFKAKSVGVSHINISGAILSDENGEPLPFEISNGTVTVISDAIPPALSYSLTGTAGSNNWYTSNVDITLTATDEHGIAEMKYMIDDGAWQDYTTPFTISTDGSHTVQFYAIDNAGNNNSTSFNVNIDREVPVLSHSLSGTAGSNNWYTSNVDVTLTATDASSGIDAIKYTINGGAEQEYTAPFTISSNGQYTIDFYAIDNAGNTAATSSFTIKIDSTSPVSSVSLSGTKEGNVYTTDVTVSISRTDSMSGIAYTKYRVNGGTWTTYTAPFTLSTDGTYTVDYYSADNAGNTESTKTATFEILKNHPPTADFSYTPANPTDTQTIHFTDNSDDTDGTIANYTWNFGDGNTSHLENPTHKYGDNGTYTVTLTVTDDKGATDTISKQIEVLNEPPTAYFKYEPTDNIKINDEVVFTDESTDKDGTIVNYTWNFGDGNVSYEKNPTHKYAKADTYTVTLTITDNDGATDSSSLDITVKKEQASSMLPILAIIILIIIAIAVVIIWRRRTGKQE